MKMFRTSLVVLACACAPLAFAQWQWIDKDGRKVFSDQAPPPGTPADKIIKRPGARAADTVPTPAPAASVPAPKVSGKEKELEEKRKQAAAAEAEKKKAAAEEFNRARAENCERARRAKSTLDSGQRLTMTNERGEVEFMSDEARAAEGKKLDAVIARDCAAAG